MPDSVIPGSVIPLSYFPSYNLFRYTPFRYAQVRYTRFPIPPTLERMRLLWRHVRFQYIVLGFHHHHQSTLYWSLLEISSIGGPRYICRSEVIYHLAITKSE